MHREQAKEVPPGAMGMDDAFGDEQGEDRHGDAPDATEDIAHLIKAGVLAEIAVHGKEADVVQGHGQKTDDFDHKAGEDLRGVLFGHVSCRLLG